MSLPEVAELGADAGVELVGEGLGVEDGDGDGLAEV
jgi:hypothetical protein